jgi:hypothetical protein
MGLINLRVYIVADWWVFYLSYEGVHIPFCCAQASVTTQVRQEIRMWAELTQRHMRVRGSRSQDAIVTYRSCTKEYRKTTEQLSLGNSLYIHERGRKTPQWQPDGPILEKPTQCLTQGRSETGPIQKWNEVSYVNSLQPVGLRSSNSRDSVNYYVRTGS